MHLTLLFSASHGLLLEAHALLLLKYLIRLLLEVDENLVLLLDFLLLTNNFHAQSVLEGDEVVGVARECLIRAPLSRADRQVLSDRTREHACFKLSV